jgi:biotin transporter BioY
VAVAQGVLIFVPFDLIKVALAVLVAAAAAPAIAMPGTRRSGRVSGRVR